MHNWMVLIVMRKEISQVLNYQIVRSITKSKDDFFPASNEDAYQISDETWAEWMLQHD